MQSRLDTLTLWYMNKIGDFQVICIRRDETESQTIYEKDHYLRIPGTDHDILIVYLPIITMQINFSQYKTVFISNFHDFHDQSLMSRTITTFSNLHDMRTFGTISNIIFTWSFVEKIEVNNIQKSSSLTEN